MYIQIVVYVNTIPTAKKVEANYAEGVNKTLKRKSFRSTKLFLAKKHKVFETSFN